MAIRTFLAFAAFMLLCLTSAIAQDFNGSWESKFESQVGEQKYVFEFKAKGDKLTGKATAEVKGEKRDPVEIQDGKIKGDEISFTEMLKIMDMEIKIEYSGKIKGDEIMLKRKVGDFAEYDITLKRVKKDEKKDDKKSTAK